MSQMSEKELQLTAAVIKNFNGSFNTAVDWEQVALDAGYKDNKNAKIMWGRLEKKLIEAAAQAAGNDDEDAGENPTTTPVTGSKKRKAPGTPGAKSSLAKAGRAAKKAKGSGGSANVNTEDQTDEAEASIE